MARVTGLDAGLPLHQEPGQTGAKAQSESRGERGPGPGFGQVGLKGIKKPGKPRPQGQPAAGRGQNWPSLLRKKKTI